MGRHKKSETSAMTEMLKNDYVNAKKTLDAIETDKVRGLDVADFIFQQFQSRIDPIYYIENILRAHLPEKSRHLHPNQIDLVRAVCDPKIRKVAAMMSRQCFAKGTEIIMYDGSLKKVEDINIGDKVLTPDNQAAQVISLSRGQAKLYKIQSENNISYTVTDNHQLVLEDQVIRVKDYIKQKLNKKGIRTILHFPYRQLNFNPEELGKQPNLWNDTILSDILYNDLSTRLSFLKGYLSISNKVIDNELFKRIAWSSGYTTTDIIQFNSSTYNFTIEEQSVDEYYGFTLDHNHMCMLKDCTIVHNSGKCFAPGTKVLMKDSTIKDVTEIKEGDLLMSPKGTGVEVINLGRGIEQMYEIQTDNSYTVNKSHILALYDKVNKEYFNIELKDYLLLPYKEHLLGYKINPYTHQISYYNFTIRKNR